MTDLSNSGAALKNYCDRYETLDRQKTDLVETRKDIYAEMKTRGLPVAALRRLIAELDKDEEKLAEARANMINAGELLGVTVYVAPAEPDADDPYSADTVGFAQQRVEAIRTLNDEIKEVSEEIKDLLKTAKSEGFPSALIPRLVAIRADPAAYYEGETLLSTCLTAIGVDTSTPGTGPATE